jgi:methionyl-tRNA synthetase
LREIPSFKDGDFTDQKFEDRYNADLAKGLGNLVSRVLSIAEKIEIKESVISKKDIENSEFESQIEKTQKNIANYLDGFEFNKALKSIWELVSFCDGFIEQERVWEKSENQEKKILLLIYTIYQIAQLLKSFLPETANKILSTIQIEEGKNLKISAQKTKSLFPKID